MATTPSNRIIEACEDPQVLEALLRMRRIGAYTERLRVGPSNPMSFYKSKDAAEMVARISPDRAVITKALSDSRVGVRLALLKNPHLTADDVKAAEAKWQGSKAHADLVLPLKERAYSTMAAEFPSPALLQLSITSLAAVMAREDGARLWSDPAYLEVVLAVNSTTLRRTHGNRVKKALAYGVDCGYWTEDTFIKVMSELPNQHLRQQLLFSAAEANYFSIGLAEAFLEKGPVSELRCSDWQGQLVGLGSRSSDKYPDLPEDLLVRLLEHVKDSERCGEPVTSSRLLWMVLSMGLSDIPDHLQAWFFSHPSADFLHGGGSLRIDAPQQLASAKVESFDLDNPDTSRKGALVQVLSSAFLVMPEQERRKIPPHWAVSAPMQNYLLRGEFDQNFDEDSISKMVRLSREILPDLNLGQLSLRLPPGLFIAMLREKHPSEVSEAEWDRLLVLLLDGAPPDTWTMAYSLLSDDLNSVEVVEAAAAATGFEVDLPPVVPIVGRAQRTATPARAKQKTSMQEDTLDLGL